MCLADQTKKLANGGFIFFHSFVLFRMAPDIVSFHYKNASQQVRATTLPAFSLKNLLLQSSLKT
jgi:hypothetical protein